MTLIEEAIERLADAVQRLEYAGHARVEAMRANPALSVEDDHQAERLAAELAAVRHDYEALQLTSQNASGRIDAAIGRLRAILET